MANRELWILFTVISLCLLSYLSQAQQSSPPPPNATCNGVFLSYTYDRGYPIMPTDRANQPYRFESTVTVLNNGRDELKSWRVFVGFQRNELLVSATNAVLADGTSLPAPVGNGTALVGFPETDLKSAIETAGDVTQMEVRVQLVGTWFRAGDKDTETPLPANLTLVNDGFSCSDPTTQGNEVNLCCMKNSNSQPNSTLDDNFAPRKYGDLVIMYDVTRTYDTNYWAQVSISNHNPLGRLDNWKLSWEWKRDEFIYAMKGAHPYVVDTSGCIFGRQGQHYDTMDFSQVLNCERSPLIMDLPPTRANDTTIGMVPFCCRNGTILPLTMDPSRSMSVFQMQVFKMPPDLNRTELVAPQNWKINGTFNSDFQCGSPVRVRPSQFPDPSGLPSSTTAIASWQVVCNITHFKEEKPKCCVSFSAFFNDSVVPCNTCACGCNKNPTQTCDANEPALLLPPQALLVPFDNRTADALEWAEMKRWNVPNPLPCGDNCGVSINWHLLSDYRNGWTARITLFNWGETDFPDWFAAVQLEKAVPGFEEVYSFNGSALPNASNTVFMQGRSGNNYLIGEKDGDNPKKDPRIPGSQQSVILFTKKKTPGIDVAGGDGFPTKVYFNGEECSLPTTLPGNGYKTGVAASVLGLLIVAAFLLFQQ